MKRLVSYFAERSLIVNLASVGLLIAGLMFLATAQREAFPRVEYDYVIISTIYPGATPSDIEKHISIPIETQLREVDGIEEIYSTSIESRSSVVLKLDPNLENKNRTIADINSAIDGISDLPKESEDPSVNELTTSQFPVIEVSIFPNKKITTDEGERKLRKKAKLLEDHLLEIDGVAKIDKKGYREREMIVEVNPYLLDKYHVGLNEIIGALSNKNLNFPGGLVRSSKEDILLRTVGEVENIQDIRDVLIRANDGERFVKISDVARVKDSFEEETITNVTSGKKSITLTVLKKGSGDIITVVDLTMKGVEKFRKILSKDYQITTSNDMSFLVKRRLNVLVNNGLVGLLLVAASLFFTLGWRIALVTAVGIPLAFSGAFVWMGQLGITINMLSMFGLILVLGMLVDDAIVVAENVYRHLEEGATPKEAVVNGTSEVIVPVAGTILTTIAAFAPLMMMSGIMGKFMWSLPAVVSLALIASWIESMFILPAHIYDIEKHRKKSVIDKNNHNEKGTRHYRIKKRYTELLAIVLHNKYKFSLLIFVIFFGTIVFAKTNMKIILFPAGKIERVVIKAEAKNGTSLTQMSNKLSNIEKIIASLPKNEVDNFITRSGIIAENSMDPNSKMGSNYGIIFLNLTPEEERTRKADQIIEFVRQKSKETKVDKLFTKIEFSYVQTGPPTGPPVSVTIKGDDFKQMKRVASEYTKYLKTIPGLKDVKDNFETGKKELKIVLKKEKAAIAGISVLDVATTVRSCFKGTVATKIKKTDEEVAIRVIFPEKFRDNISSLDLVNISNKMGNLVPLRAITDFEKDRGLSVINRQAWKRAIKVTAAIDEKAKDVTSVYVNGLLQKKFKDVQEKYEGVIVDYLGEFKDTQESIQNLMRSFIIAILVIYIILVALFKSLSHPLIIINVIPLTLIGVVWVFFFHGLPLSFLAMLGIVALAGVVVNDSIVLVDFIKNARAKGLSAFDASISAGGNRLRAVFLTTITTFLGLVPVAYGWGGSDPFLKPMAIAMSWGLIFGTLITLFVTPILYNIFADIRKLFTKKDQLASEFVDPDVYIDHEVEDKMMDDLKVDIKKEIKKVVKAELKKQKQKEKK